MDADTNNSVTIIREIYSGDIGNDIQQDPTQISTPAPATYEDILKGIYENNGIEISDSEVATLKNYYPEWTLSIIAALPDDIRPGILQELQLIQCGMQVQSEEALKARQEISKLFSEALMKYPDVKLNFNENAGELSYNFGSSPLSISYNDLLDPFKRFQALQTLSFSDFMVKGGNNFTVEGHPTLTVIDDQGVPNIQGDVVVDKNLAGTFTDLFIKLRSLQKGDDSSTAPMWITGTLNSENWLNMLSELCGFAVPRTLGLIHPSTEGASVTLAFNDPVYESKMIPLNETERAALNTLNETILASQTEIVDENGKVTYSAPPFLTFGEMIELGIISDPDIIEAYNTIVKFADENGGIVVDMTAAYSFAKNEEGKWYLIDRLNPVFSVAFSPQPGEEITPLGDEISYNDALVAIRDVKISQAVETQGNMSITLKDNSILEIPHLTFLAILEDLRG